MKTKLKHLLLLTLLVALVFTFAACGAVDNTDAADQDQPAQQAQADADQDAAAAEAEQVDSEDDSGLLANAPAAANYTGPRTKVGKMFSGWFAKLFEWLYLLTDAVHMPSWILTVFLFTLIVRLLMQPLMAKQMRSSRKMQLLKPELDEIRRRYATNQVKANEATMALYKENDCSPTAGCLPLLIQMPILIWLFAAIRTYDPLASSYETIVNSNFSFLWIPDLSQMDPTGWLLPLLVAAATFVQQWLTTVDRTDRTQRMMMFMMPLMFFFFARSFPSLMCFYWIFYSLVSAAIMWPAMRKWEKEDKKKIEEARRVKEEEAERRRQKKAAAKEAAAKKRQSKPKKTSYEVQEGDMVEEEEPEEDEWDDDLVYEFDPEQDLTTNFDRYLASQHIKVKEKKMKLHPYSLEPELVKLAFDENGKELDYDAMKRSFVAQHKANEQMANSRLGKLFGANANKKAAETSAAVSAAADAEAAAESVADAAETAGEAVEAAAETAAAETALEEAAEAAAEVAAEAEAADAVSEQD